MCRHDRGSYTDHAERDRLAEKLVTQVTLANALTQVGGDFAGKAAEYVADAKAKAIALDLGSANRVKVLSIVADFYGATDNAAEQGAAIVAALDFVKAGVVLPASTPETRQPVQEVDEDAEDEEDEDEGEEDES